MYTKIGNLISIILSLVLIAPTTILCQNANFELVLDDGTKFQLSSEGDFGARECESEIEGEIVFASTGGNTNDCPPEIIESDSLNGKIVLIDKFECSLLQHALLVEQKDGIAIIICNDVPGNELFYLAANELETSRIDISIPTFSTSQETCDELKISIGNSNNGKTLRASQGYKDNFAEEEILWSEDFNSGSNEWRITSEFCMTNNSRANWIWRDDGLISEGQFAIEDLEFVSATACNGYMVFDSDFLDSGGKDFGQGTCPAIHRGSITSPLISLDDENVGDIIGLKFAQSLRYFNSSFIIEWTTDQGLNWNQKFVNGIERNVDQSGIFRMLLTDVRRGDELRLRFTFWGELYFWAIDDIAIINLEESNLRLSDSFYPVNSYAVPVTHATTEFFTFGSEVQNIGGGEVDSFEYNIEIKNEGTGESVFNRSSFFGNLKVNGRRNLDLVNDENERISFTPRKLNPGLYSINYSIEIIDKEDANFEDNSEMFFFEITENSYSKAGLLDQSRFRYRASENDEWGLGAFFLTAENVGNFEAEKIEFAATTSGSSIENFVADVLLFKQVNVGNFYFPTEFTDDVNSFANHPNLELLYQKTHVFTETSQTEFVSIDLTNLGIDKLEANTGYIVMVFFDNNVTSTIGLPNNDLYLLADDNVEMKDVYIYLPNRATSWFSGFSEFTPPGPYISMTISLRSPNENVIPGTKFLKVFPNPAKDFFSLEGLFEEAITLQLVLRSMDGKIIESRQLLKQDRINEQFDVSNVEAGMYIFQIIHKGRIFSKLVSLL